MTACPHLLDLLEQLVLVLVVEGVGVGDIVQSLLRFQGREHDLVLGLHSMTASFEVSSRLQSDFSSKT